MTYQALQIEKDDAGYRCTLKTLEDSALPEGDVTVQVDFSTVNYKDGLAITGKSPVVRKFPLTPGIDLSGTVTDSQHPLFKAGDQVPMMPLLEVVGNAESACPLQMAATALNVGIVLAELTTICAALLTTVPATEVI